MPVPTPPRTPTPAASPRPTATLSPTPSPSPTPQGAAPRSVTLTEGTNDFTYVGPTLPVNQVFASIAGKYTIAYFHSPSTGELVAYKPTDSFAPVLPTNTAVRLIMPKGVYVIFSMAP
jgi:hypothetical protein